MLLILPSKMSNELKSMLSRNLSLIFELFQYAITIALKVSLLVKEKEFQLFLLMESVDISPCGFFCERKESWC